MKSSHNEDAHVSSLCEQTLIRRNRRVPNGTYVGGEDGDSSLYRKDVPFPIVRFEAFVLKMADSSFAM